jgi:hypothetical protein
MRTITISDEAADFLAEFTARLSRQNNRGTAFPFYFTVRCVKEVAAPEGCTDEVRYFDSQQVENYTEEDMRKNCEEMEVDFDEYVSEHCTKYCAQDIEMNENVFFTLEGYQEHMRLNGHNYRHYKDKYDYVEHAWRNPEIASLLSAVKEIGEALGSAARPVPEENGPKKEC